MDIENIAENARAVVKLQAEVDAAFIKQTTGLDSLNSGMSR